MAGESTKATRVQYTLFNFNKNISPPLAQQFDSPKDKTKPQYIRNPANRYNIPIINTPSLHVLPISHTPTDKTIKNSTTDISHNQLLLHQMVINHDSEEIPIQITDDAKEIFMNLNSKKKYKPVACKIKPVIGELPDKFRIVRNIIGVTTFPYLILSSLII